VLDALGTKAWGQAEISDFVRAAFAEDMQRHNAEISNIIRELEQRSTRSIPVISPSAREDGSISYVAIETGVDASPSIRPSGPVSDSPSDVYGQALQVGGSKVTRVKARSSFASIAGIVAGAAAALVAGLVLIGDPLLSGKPAVAPAPVA